MLNSPIQATILNQLELLASISPDLDMAYASAVIEPFL